MKRIFGRGGHDDGIVVGPLGHRCHKYPSSFGRNVHFEMKGRIVGVRRVGGVGRVSSQSMGNVQTHLQIHTRPSCTAGRFVPRRVSCPSCEC